MNWQDPYAVEIRKVLTEAPEDEPDKTGYEQDMNAALDEIIEVRHFDTQPRWTVGDFVPGTEDKFRILAFFQGENADLYAYVYPAAQDAAGKEWRRYTLSRIGAVAILEVMSRETFVSEVVKEFEDILDAEQEEEGEPTSPPPPN